MYSLKFKNISNLKFKVQFLLNMYYPLLYCFCIIDIRTVDITGILKLSVSGVSCKAVAHHPSALQFSVIGSALYAVLFHGTVKDPEGFCE